MPPRRSSLRSPPLAALVLLFSCAPEMPPPETAPAELTDPASPLLSAVVSLGGCSASFVSPDGLIITNHHGVTGALQYNSTPEKNLLKTGFLAPSREAEKHPDAPWHRVYLRYHRGRAPPVDRPARRGAELGLRPRHDPRHGRGQGVKRHPKLGFNVGLGKCEINLNEINRVGSSGVFDLAVRWFGAFQRANGDAGTSVPRGAIPPVVLLD